MHFVKGHKRSESRLCPKCYPYKKKEYKLGAISVPIYYDNKKCSRCFGLLELSRYKVCIKCNKNIQSDFIEYEM